VRIAAILLSIWLAPGETTATAWLTCILGVLGGNCLLGAWARSRWPGKAWVRDIADEADGHFVHVLPPAALLGCAFLQLTGGRAVTRTPRVHYRGPLACKRFGVTTEYQSEVTCLHCRRRIKAWWAGQATPAELKALGGEQ